MGSIPESFSTDFFTKYMALAARGKGCARGSQSGDIWTQEETMRATYWIISQVLCSKD